MVYINKNADYSELKEIAQRYGISRITLWRARKRGYFCLDYHKREVNKAENISDDIVKSWYDLARKVYFKMFKDYNEESRDLVQEAVIRLWELSGKKEIESFGYKWSICINAMRSWLSNGFSKRLSSEKLDENYIFELDYIDESYLNFELWEAIYRNFSEKERKEIQEFINGNKVTLSERVKSKLFKLLTSK